MQAEFINPFLRASNEVLISELGSAPKRGTIGFEQTAFTTDDVTAVVAVTGDVAGMVMFVLTESSARGMVAKMMGQEFPEFDDLAQSGIAELGNVIAGRAGVLLAEAGFKTDLAPPMLIVGRGSTINTLGVPRLVIPLETELGGIEIQVALTVSSSSGRGA